MKHLNKFISLMLALCIMLGTFAGCGSEDDSVQYAKPETMENVASGVVAKNDYYTMKWNENLASIEFVEKDGTVWSTVPESFLNNSIYDDYDDDPLTYNTQMMEIDGVIASSLVIDCLIAEQTFTYNSLTHCVNKDKAFTSKKLENGNGISVTYYFDEVEAEVTVEYYLEGDSFKVKVDPANIKCYGDAIVTEVNPTPFMCAADVVVKGGATETATDDTLSDDTYTDDYTYDYTDDYSYDYESDVTDETAVEEEEEDKPLALENDENEYDYMVIPSGEGALVYCHTRNSLTPKSFSGEVYGSDYSVDEWENASNEVGITMPFYGITRGEKAICAIIEQGENSCEIEAELNTMAGYYGNVSTVYNVTGYNMVYGTSKWRAQYNDYVETNLETLVVGYYPLSGDDANYTGMAKKYREYLIENEGLKKSQDNSLLTAKIIGGYTEDDLFLGIPTEKQVSLTSYAEAETIVKELSEISGGSLVIDMYAYGDGGLNATKIAGGYKLTGFAGTKADLESFLQYAKDNNVDTYFNFDPIIYYESGNGYSTSKDTAVSANGIPAPVRQFWYSIHGRLENSNGGITGGLVARAQLNKAVAETVELADKYGITGLAFNTLGNVAYSDYEEDDDKNPTYPLKNGMSDQVTEIINETKSSSKTVLVDGANSYAAVAADVIAGCPTTSNRDNTFDKDVPLYQIVFQGLKSNSVYSINMTENSDTQFLKAIETGSGLSFTLMANYETELRKQYARRLNTTVYKDNKSDIETYVTRSKNYLTKVAGASITAHEYITDDVVKTVFDNGVTVIVNYGESDYSSDLGTVKANDFLYK